MCKKTIFLCISFIFSNSFCETPTEKTTVNDVDKRIILKQLDIFEKENRELQEAHGSLYSTERQLVNGVTLFFSSAAIGAMILSVNSNHGTANKQLVYTVLRV